VDDPLGDIVGIVSKIDIDVSTWMDALNPSQEDSARYDQKIIRSHGSMFPMACGDDTSAGSRATMDLGIIYPGIYHDERTLTKPQGW